MTQLLSIQKLQGEHKTTYTYTMYAQIQDTHIYTHVIIKHRARKIFLKKSFIFNIKTRVFMTESFQF